MAARRWAAVAGRYARKLDHARDDVGLRDRLSGRDGQRCVLVGVLLHRVVDEAFARHAAHGVEHVRLVHATRGDLPAHHLLALGAEILHAPGFRTHPNECLVEAP